MRKMAFTLIIIATTITIGASGYAVLKTAQYNRKQKLLQEFIAL